jgi:hypothetical protein
LSVARQAFRAVEAYGYRSLDNYSLRLLNVLSANPFSPLKVSFPESIEPPIALGDRRFKSGLHGGATRAEYRGIVEVREAGCGVTQRRASLNTTTQI